MTGARFAPAKVNLFLRVVGRRADGYHLLDSLAVFADVGDRLAFTPGGPLRLAVTGPFAPALGAGDNLVLRAARALAHEAGVAPHGAVTLEKRLPVASGIGGGSSDAAAALRLLAACWNVAMPEADLHRIAATLGADVPVCLAASPARMGGIGEMLSAAPSLPAFGLLLVNPGVAVPTSAVFARRTGPFGTPARLPAAWADAAEMAADLAAIPNDLETPARALHPEIGGVLAAISATPRCLLARMSGSGATCFGLLPSAEDAAASARALARPGWWVWGGGPAIAEPAAAPL